MGYVVLFVIFTIQLLGSFAIITRHIDNYEFEATKLSSNSPKWIAGLKEATYRAFVRQGWIEPGLRQHVHDAPIIGHENPTSPFGDISVLARGQLFYSAGSLTFVHDQQLYDCEECNDVPAYRNSPNYGQILALWTVRRIRHRLHAENFRFEVEYKISPITNEYLKANGKFNYDAPGHVFVLNEIINGPERYTQPSNSYLPSRNSRDRHYLPPYTTQPTVLYYTKKNYQYHTEKPQKPESNLEKEIEIYNKLLQTLKNKQQGLSTIAQQQETLTTVSSFNKFEAVKPVMAPMTIQPERFEDDIFKTSTPKTTSFRPHPTISQTSLLQTYPTTLYKPSITSNAKPFKTRITTSQTTPTGESSKTMHFQTTSLFERGSTILFKPSPITPIIPPRTTSTINHLNPEEDTQFTMGQSNILLSTEIPTSIPIYTPTKFSMHTPKSTTRKQPASVDDFFDIFQPSKQPQVRTTSESATETAKVPEVTEQMPPPDHVFSASESYPTSLMINIPLKEKNETFASDTTHFVFTKPDRSRPATTAMPTTRYTHENNISGMTNKEDYLQSSESSAENTTRIMEELETVHLGSTTTRTTSFTNEGKEDGIKTTSSKTTILSIKEDKNENQLTTSVETVDEVTHKVTIIESTKPEIFSETSFSVHTLSPKSTTKITPAMEELTTTLTTRPSASTPQDDSIPSNDTIHTTKTLTSKTAKPSINQTPTASSSTKRPKSTRKFSKFSKSPSPNQQTKGNNTEVQKSTTSPRRYTTKKIKKYKYTRTPKRHGTKTTQEEKITPTSTEGPKYSPVTKKIMITTNTENYNDNLKTKSPKTPTRRTKLTTLKEAGNSTEIYRPPETKSSDVKQPTSTEITRVETNRPQQDSATIPPKPATLDIQLRQNKTFYPKQQTTPPKVIPTLHLTPPTVITSITQDPKEILNDIFGKYTKSTTITVTTRKKPKPSAEVDELFGDLNRKKPVAKLKKKISTDSSQRIQSSKKKTTTIIAPTANITSQTINEISPATSTASPEPKITFSTKNSLPTTTSFQISDFREDSTEAILTTLKLDEISGSGKADFKEMEDYDVNESNVPTPKIIFSNFYVASTLTTTTLPLEIEVEESEETIATTDTPFTTEINGGDLVTTTEKDIEDTNHPTTLEVFTTETTLDDEILGAHFTTNDLTTTESVAKVFDSLTLSLLNNARGIKYLSKKRRSGKRKKKIVKGKSST